jgi:hypothetical protein
LRWLVLPGERICRTPEQFKAWSQNLGHEKPLMTFCSYGNLDIIGKLKSCERWGEKLGFSYGKA